jgi:GT2 family glycosyltransferase
MRTTVVIPTWMRAVWLDRCLSALAIQEPKPDEIVVIGRREDGEALRVTERWAGIGLRIRWSEVQEAGHIPPILRGFEKARGDIVAFIDDDAEPTEGWLENLLSTFEEGIACVGGRVQAPGLARKVHPDAGRIRWYGKHIGNVGASDGAASRDVDGVMEGNWAWRSAVARQLDFAPVFFDDDAAMYGLDLCLQAKERGYRIVYQPRASVFHHAAARDPSLDRAHRPERTRTYSRNYTYIALRHFRGLRRLAFLAWWWLVGERGSYGLATAAFDFVARGPAGTLPLARVSWKGKWEGVTAWRAARP